MAEIEPQEITLQQAAKLIEQADAVIFHSMALAWGFTEFGVDGSGPADQIWLDYTHVDDDAGLEFRFAFDHRPQQIILRGADIELEDIEGDKTTIQLLKTWHPKLD